MIKFQELERGRGFEIMGESPSEKPTYTRGKNAKEQALVGQGKTCSTKKT